MGKEIESYEVPEYLLENKTDHDHYEEPVEGRDCERRVTTWYEPIETSLEVELFGKEEEKPRSGLGVDMFRCPFSEMNVTFKEKSQPTNTARNTARKSKKREEKNDLPTSCDFYMSIGRNLLTVAILKNSAKGGNICLKEVHYYPAAKPKIDACFLEHKEW